MSLDLLGVFGAGLLTFATPCVLPLVPIYLSALIGTDIRQLTAGRRGQLLLRAIFFTLGFTLVFTFLGMTASSIGRALVTHKSVLQATGAMLIMVFALKFLGVIQIPWLDRTLQADDRRLTTRFGGVNAFLMGVVFAAGWSPCAGPVLGSVLTYTASTTSEPLTGALYLSTYGLGFALPLLLVAIFAEAASRLLKRISPHLPKIERAIGLLLVFVAFALLLDLPGGTASAEAGSCPGRGLVAEDATGERQPTMVIFTARNCAVCRRMRPLLDRMMLECHGKKVFIREIDLSAEAHRGYRATYRLVGTPTFVFLDRAGDEVARLVGEQTESTLKQAVSALRGEPCPGLELIGDPELPADTPESRGAACERSDPAGKSPDTSLPSSGLSPSPSCE